MQQKQNQEKNHLDFYIYSYIESLRLASYLHKALLKLNKFK
jgi:hypothetical protein